MPASAARAWVRLPSGRRLNLLDPTPFDWADEDLALGLARGEDDLIGWRALPSSELTARLGLVDLGAPPELLADSLSSLRVFAGYAGWAAGQLTGEIESGAWLVLDALPGDAFVTEPSRLYPAVLRRQGGEMALLSTFPDDPVLN